MHLVFLTYWQNIYAQKSCGLYCSPISWIIETKDSDAGGCGLLSLHVEDDDEKHALDNVARRSVDVRAIRLRGDFETEAIDAELVMWTTSVKQGSQIEK